MVSLKERFDTLQTIGFERDFTDEECRMIGVLAEEARLIPPARPEGRAGRIDHPLVNFWSAFAKDANSVEVVKRNLLKMHEHLSMAIVAVATARSKDESTG